MVSDAGGGLSVRTNACWTSPELLGSGQFASAIEPAFAGARRAAGQGLTTWRQFGAADARGQRTS
jgi:hypothetical protein